MMTMTPIIKVVGNFCNLRCDYCFYHICEQAKPQIMDKVMLESFIKQYLSLFCGNVFFIWHGGEPLLAGIPFFESVVSFQAMHKKNHVIKNMIQTNATLVNDDWAQFFKTNNFRVGVSLDGNEESHNRFRKRGSGDGSFSQVMRGIKILRDHGIEPGIIQTITADNLSRTKENFHFFVNAIGAKGWGTNIYLDTDNSNRAMLGQSITNKQLTDFLINQIDLWLIQDNVNLRIREIENFISGILNKKPSSCAFNGSCTRYFYLECDGRIYPCDRSSGRPDLLLGNLSRQSLQEILSSTTKSDYDKQVSNLPSECLTCEWQKSCNNGCTMNRVGWIGGKYYFCETRKAIFSYLRNRITELGFRA